MSSSEPPMDHSVWHATPPTPTPTPNRRHDRYTRNPPYQSTTTSADAATTEASQQAAPRAVPAVAEPVGWKGHQAQRPRAATRRSVRPAPAPIQAILSHRGYVPFAIQLTAML